MRVFDDQLTWLEYEINEDGYSPKFSKTEEIQSLKLFTHPHFMNIINLIPSLFHYDSSKKPRINCDASHNGLGACLEQEVQLMSGHQLLLPVGSLITRT